MVVFPCLPFRACLHISNESELWHCTVRIASKREARLSISSQFVRDVLSTVERNEREGGRGDRSVIAGNGDGSGKCSGDGVSSAELIPMFTFAGPRKLSYQFPLMHLLD